MRPELPDIRIFANMAVRTPFMQNIRSSLLPALSDTYSDLYAATEQADILVSTSCTYAAPVVAEVRGITLVSSVLAPGVLDWHYSPPVISGAGGLARLRARLKRVYILVLRWADKRLTRRDDRPIGRLRAQHGLPDNPPHIVGHLCRSRELVLAMYPSLLEKPGVVWGPPLRITGAAFWDETGPVPGEAELKSFLAQGSPPITFTLGSMVAFTDGAERFYAASLEAARRLGRRAVLLTGSPNAVGVPKDLPEWAFALPYVPHARIFPASAVVVHHGGAGSLAQAMRAGRPMLIVPYAFDQPSNAAHAAHLGIARVIRPGRYTPANAARELNRLLTDPAITARTAEIALHLANEDGTANACDAIEQLLHRQRGRSVGAPVDAALVPTH